MNILNAMPIKLKLPILVVGLSLLTGIALEISVYTNIRTESLSDAVDTLEEGLNSVKRELQQKVENRIVSIQSLASNRDIVDSIRMLSMTFLTEPNSGEQLFDQYVTSNPNLSGDHDQLARGAGSETYNLVHAKVHPGFVDFMKTNGLYDIFLFDVNFNNLYTVEKETDFLQNFGTEEFSVTPLGTVLRQAKAGEVGTVYASNFEAYAPSNGDAAAFMATQISDTQGHTIGYLAVQLPADELTIDLNNMSWIGTSGDVFLVDDQKRAQSNSRYQNLFKLFDSFPDRPQILAAQVGQNGVFLDVPLASGERGFAVTDSFSAGGETWAIVAERDYSDVMAFTNQSMVKSLIVGSLIIAISLLIGVKVSRSIVLPIERLSAGLEAMATGNLDLAINDAERGDEIGQMAKSLGRLLETLSLAQIAETERVQMQREIGLVLEALTDALKVLAAGDLSQEISEAFTQDYDSLRLDFNLTLMRLTTTLSQVVDASENIRSRTTEIATASEDLARRTENQAAALEQAAAALDQLTVSVSNATKGAQEVEAITRDARIEAEESGEVVQSAVLAMSKIEKSSDQISQIIGAIDDIAFQTNLLALNAGVEAARAGEAGKGFAVVASEVRALAQRSSAAAKEIKTLISESAHHVHEGVDHVGKAGSALLNIVGSVSNISSLVSKLAMSSAEQSRGLAEINLGMSQLDQVTQQNAAMVEETTAASHALRQDAVGLARLVSVFVLPRVQQNGKYQLGDDVVQTNTDNVGLSQRGKTSWDNALPMKTADMGGKSIWQDF